MPFVNQFLPITLVQQSLQKSFMSSRRIQKISQQPNFICKQCRSYPAILQLSIMLQLDWKNVQMYPDVQANIGTVSHIISGLWVRTASSTSEPGGWTECKLHSHAGIRCMAQYRRRKPWREVCSSAPGLRGRGGPLGLWQKWQHPQSHEFLNPEVPQPAEDNHHCLGTTYRVIISFIKLLCNWLKEYFIPELKCPKKRSKTNKKHNKMCYLLSLLKLYDSLVHSLVLIQTIAMIQFHSKEKSSL